MNQENESANSHIEEYLDYYCGLTESPKFAVLLKGQWGAGKTCFIKQYCEKNTKKKISIFKDHVNAELLSEVWQNINIVAKLWRKLRKKEQVSSKKFLYVSLYGLDTLSAIDEAIFQELHPLWGSEQIKIAGNIIKGFINASIKIDLNASLNIKALDIPRNTKCSNNKGVNRKVLIFDDLERCTINISNLLGYINQFIEHQNLKVILIANEVKLKERTPDYGDMKEKLICKTFEVVFDFESTLNELLVKENTDIKEFLSQNIDFLKNIYNLTECKNLRILRQIILDFKRIFKELPEKAKNEPKVLKDILKYLTLLSIEINQSKIHSNDIVKLADECISQLAKSIPVKAPQYLMTSYKLDKNSNGEKTLERIDLYLKLELHRAFPSPKWWEIFFDKGEIKSEELNTLTLEKYFPENQTTSDWRKLYKFYRLTDHDFEDLLKKVELDYRDKKFLDLREVKHVFGIFLTLSDKKLYYKNKVDILSEAKAYVDHLNKCNKIKPLPYSANDDIYGNKYGDIPFYGFNEFREFKELDSYIYRLRESLRDNNLPNDARDLLKVMSSDSNGLSKIIQFSEILESVYYKFPILNHINVNDFVDNLMSMDSEEKQYIFQTLEIRYSNINDQLLDETEWLKHLRNTIDKKAESIKDSLPLSSNIVIRLNRNCLDKIIIKLDIENKIKWLYFLNQIILDSSKSISNNFSRYILQLIIQTYQDSLNEVILWLKYINI
ncbi:P-loop NTPase fold protein [Pseudanabaena sp. BC1403]|uniref:P-loop NTPase fold protein n=1 Tax=Pseudanabaena sp. BC1403 TaxID=2043171 RepID=UPI000CD7E411|nr:P-loop NTPase fold protein [Pseudanabaena sp. BC1403]